MKWFIILIILCFHVVSAQTDSSKKGINNKLIYPVPIEIMPKIIGGMDSLQSKIQYPKEAINSKVEGKVYLKASIDTLGNVSDVEVIRGIGYGCNEEALRVVKNAKFTPAINKGKKVKCTISIPIKFTLSDKE